jgi:hypothetical protein
LPSGFLWQTDEVTPSAKAVVERVALLAGRRVLLQPFDPRGEIQPYNDHRTPGVFEQDAK